MMSSASTFEPDDSDVEILETPEVQKDIIVVDSDSNSSHDHSPKTSSVWAVGDRCKAPYTEDGDCQYYLGTIVALKKNKNYQMIATVNYDGYDDVDNEDIKIEKLKSVKTGKPVKKKNQADEVSLFTPLTGTENQKHLDEKYREYDNDTSSVLDKLDEITVKVKRKKKRKAIVATGGEEKPASDRSVKMEKTEEKDSTASDLSIDKLDKTEPDSPKVENLFDFDTPPSSPANESNKLNIPSTTEEEVWGSGFDEEFMEKPTFSHVPPHPKVPYVLTSPDETPTVQVPATLNQFLRDYQREGIQFMYNQFKQNKGGILGDDMGLGKTVQVIGFLSAIMDKTGTKEDAYGRRPKFIREMSESKLKVDESPKEPVLIVCPGSVLYNWMDELETWGYFSVGRYHHSLKESTLSDVRKGKLEVVLTTFETFRDNVDSLNQIIWKAVIVDEVHKIKSLKSQITEALNKMKTRRRFGLTGTALQNNMTELYALLDWANPNCLGSPKYFSERFARPIEQGQKHDVTKRQLAEARIRKEKFAKLRNQWMIRRTKDIIADQLPKKDDKVVFCKLTDIQVSVYEAILGHNDVSNMILRRRELCDCGSKKQRQKCHYSQNFIGENVCALVFSYMMLLMKASNHVALLIPDKSPSELQKKKSKEIMDVAFAAHPQFVTQSKESAFKTLSDPRYCGKMKILQGMLSVLRKEESKVLLFSYSTKLLDILEHYIISEGYEYRRIDGKVPDRKRHQTVREFNLDPDLFIFLISTKAGGLGLNITGANVVIIYDPNWNPTHDLQAQDRAYRIGQRRDVRVYRLISTGTIEEIMYLRQIYKQQLDRVAIADENARRYFYAGQNANGQRQGELFGLDNLFQLRLGEGSFTSDVLERHQLIENNLGVKTAPYVAVEDVDSKTDHNVLDEILDEDGTERKSRKKPKKRSVIESSDSEEELLNIKEEVMSEEDEEEDCCSTEEEFSDDNNNENENPPGTSGDKNTNSKKCSQDLLDDFLDLDGCKRCGANVDLKPIDNVCNNDLSCDNKDMCESREKVAGTKRKYHDMSSDDEQHTSTKKTVQSGKVPKTRIDESFDSVSDVFDKLGVVHIHEHKKLIGGSKAEDHMTKCAIKDVYENQKNEELSQLPAMDCEPVSEPEEDTSPPPKIKRLPALTSMSIGSKKILIGQTPPTIKRKEFKNIAEASGKSVKSFAQRVVNLDHDALMEVLKIHYTSIDPEFSQVFDVLNAKVESKVKKSSMKETNRNSKSNKKNKSLSTKKPKTTSIRNKSTKGVKLPAALSSDADLEPIAGPSQLRRNKNYLIPRNRKTQPTSQFVDEEIDKNYRKFGKKHLSFENDSSQEYPCSSLFSSSRKFHVKRKGKHLDQSLSRKGKGVGKSSSSKVEKDVAVANVAKSGDVNSIDTVINKMNNPTEIVDKTELGNKNKSVESGSFKLSEDNVSFLDSLIDLPIPIRNSKCNQSKTLKRKNDIKSCTLSSESAAEIDSLSYNPSTETSCDDFLDNLFKNTPESQTKVGQNSERKPPPKKTNKRDKTLTPTGNIFALR